MSEILINICLAIIAVSITLSIKSIRKSNNIGEDMNRFIPETQFTITTKQIVATSLYESKQWIRDLNKFHMYINGVCHCFKRLKFKEIYGSIK